MNALKVGSRKLSSLANYKFQTHSELQVYMNRKPLSYYKDSFVYSPVLKQIERTLKGRFYVTIKGGGVASQLEILIQFLVRFCPSSQIRNLRAIDPFIDRTDSRMPKPKKYGGKGSSARSQKSYR